MLARCLLQEGVCSTSVPGLVPSSQLLIYFSQPPWAYVLWSLLQEKPDSTVSPRFNLTCCCCCLVPRLCPTLCDPKNCSPPGSYVHWISQAEILEWVAIFSSRGSSQLRDQTHISCIGTRVLYHWATWEALTWDASTLKNLRTCSLTSTKNHQIICHYFCQERVVMLSPYHPAGTWGQLVLVYLCGWWECLLLSLMIPLYLCNYTLAPKHSICCFYDRANSTKFIEWLGHIRLYFRSSGEGRDEKLENLPSGSLCWGDGGRQAHNQP